MATATHKILRLATIAAGLCLVALPLLTTGPENPFYYRGNDFANAVEEHSMLICLALLAGILLPLALATWRHKRRPQRSTLLAAAFVAASVVPATLTGAAHLLPLLAGTAGLALLALALPEQWGEWLSQAWPRLARPVMNMTPGRFVFCLFALSMALNLLVAWFVFEGTPHVQDGIDHLFGARLLADGQLTAPAPPHSLAFFFPHLVVHRFEWFPQYPPGWTALLAGGVWLGVPWAVNPLLGALVSIAFCSLGATLWGEPRGRGVGLLAALCPFVVVQSASHMSHTSALLFSVLAVRQWLVFRKAPRAGAGLLGGLALGAAFLIRPFDSLVVGLGILADMLLSARAPGAGLHKTAQRCIWILCGFLGPFFVFLLYHRAVTGAWFVTGYELYFRQSLLGHFITGPEGSDWSAALAGNLLKMSTWLAALNKNLLELPFPALVLLVPAARAFSREQRILWAVSLAAVLLMTPYWYGELCYGPRLLTPALVGLVPLTAAGLSQMPEWLGRTFSANAVRRWALFVALAVALGLATQLPRTLQIYSDNYWGTVPSLPKAVDRCNIGHSVVFVDTKHADRLFAPARISRHNLYNAFFNANSPHLDSPIVYARDLGDENIQVMQYFPDRTPWRLSLTPDTSRAVVTSLTQASTMHTTVVLPSGLWIMKVRR